MANEGKTEHKRKRKNRYQGDKFVSDDSDEDYKVDEDEALDESEEEDCVSWLAEDESQESLGEFVEEDVEEEEEWIEEITEKVRMPRERKKTQSRGKIVPMKPIKKKIYTDSFSVSDGTKSNGAEEEINSCNVDWFREERDEFTDRKPRKKLPRLKKTRTRLPGIHNAGEEGMSKYVEDEEDYDDDADDVDFIPSEEMETNIDEPKKKQVPKRNRSTSAKKLNPRKRTAQKKKNRDMNCVRRDSNVSSDSDFECQVSSDDDDEDDDDEDFTMSEEESEFIRESNEFCERPTAGLRRSTLLETVKEEESPLKIKDQGRKGKQKVVEMKVQVVKQVCGICLSEEGKRKAVGVLSSCTHFFCFTCIMEWSKVESRCPLCKQRFATITRTMRSDGIHDTRDAIFPVPERDQVYQPSEEELRGYLDPYENVLCTECHQGGNDAVMLLCDLCDSSAHTYCVGLNEVPEGNWYCNGCRPTAAAPENGASNHIHSTPVGSQSANAVREPFDLNEAYVPETPPTPSPRSSTPQMRGTSPTFGSTLFNRRRIYRQIFEIRNFGNRQNGMNAAAAAAPGATGIDLLGSLITSPSAPPNRDVFSSSVRGEAFSGHSSTTSSSHGVAASGFNGRIGGLYS